MITRVSGEEWTILETIDSHYGTESMQVYDWSISFSYRMMLGLGPKVAPRVDDVPAFTNAPAYGVAKIGAYIGIPLELPNGKLFGILTGIDPEPWGDDLYSLLPELELHGKWLMDLFVYEQQIAQLEYKVLRLQNPEWTDPQTGTFSIDAWASDMIDMESCRANQAEPNGVIYFDTSRLDSETYASFIRKLRQIVGQDKPIYHEPSAVFVALRNIIRDDQNAIRQRIQSKLLGQFPNVPKSYRYRDLDHSISVTLDACRKQIQQSQSKKAA